MDSDLPAQPPVKIDATVPVSARIWNYWLGGKDYYPVDKEAGDRFAQFYPGIFDGPARRVISSPGLPATWPGTPGSASSARPRT